MANSKNKFVELDEEAIYDEVVSMKNNLNKVELEKSVRGLTDTSVFKKHVKKLLKPLRNYGVENWQNILLKNLEKGQEFVLVALDLKK
ncbi:MAG: hypothetical protein HC817_01445 [Saprospiraceae bacterium]|nr:hypothetical protein [Saprospiraceae bacterium]